MDGGVIDNGVVATLVQGGAVGLALVAIGGLFYALRALLNHLPHIEEILATLLAEVRSLHRERDGN